MAEKVFELSIKATSSSATLVEKSRVRVYIISYYFCCLLLVCRYKLSLVNLCVVYFNSTALGGYYWLLK